VSTRSKPARGAWGGAETRYFYELTPERILDAVERLGLECTGRCMALNSMENRVYQVEVADEGGQFRIVKFYRPGRWTREQILEEHAFLGDLVEHEVPAVAPIELPTGGTLATADEIGIHYAVFPRVGGRAPDELGEEELRRMGRLMARLHNVGALREAPARIRLDPTTYGRDNLAFLRDADVLPESVRDGYCALVERICDVVDPWFEETAYQRIHGDCHIGNVLHGRDAFFLVDFDDMVRGPCVQDVWLLIAGRDATARAHTELFLGAYEEMRDFDRRSLRLIEPLRALRFVHFSAWIARRWDDPAFKRVFIDFGTERYWFDEVESLREQLGRIEEVASA